MIVYEDGACAAELVEDGATLGQIRISPKESAPTLMDLDEDVSNHLFYVASFAATAVFEGMGAQGTNILVREGDAVEVVVVPRMEGDGLDLFWDPERANPQELETVAAKIKDKLFYVGKDAQPDRKRPETKPTRPRQQEKDVPLEQDYRYRQLNRAP